MESDEEKLTPQVQAELNRLFSKADEVMEKIHQGTHGEDASIGFATPEIFDLLSNLAKRKYKFSFGINRMCEESFKEDGGGEIVIWGE